MKALLFLTVMLASCGPSPTATGTVCPAPDPMVVAYSKVLDPTCQGDDQSACGFGKHFMQTYCVSCHDSALDRPQRHGAPLYHDFNTLLGVLKVVDHVDEQSGYGPRANNTFMPPTRCPSVPGGALDIDCPQPTDAEREQLAVWLACENAREHDFALEH